MQEFRSWNHDFLQGAFWLEVDLAINVMIKQSDLVYRVNNVVKGVVTVSSRGWQRKMGFVVSPPETFDTYWCDLVQFGNIHSLKHSTKMGAFSVKCYYLSVPCEKIITIKVVSYFHSDFFQVNIFVQMQIDKYLYVISENAIMYSSRYAKIWRFRLRQTGHEANFRTFYLENNDQRHLRFDLSSTV